MGTNKWKVTGTITRREQRPDASAVTEHYDLTIEEVPPPPTPAVRVKVVWGDPQPKGLKPVSVSISDQEYVVGSLDELDALNLPADDPIVSASYASDNPDCTVVSGDISPGGDPGDMTKVSASASGTAVGVANITGTIVTQSGASLPYADQVQVNGGAATTVGTTWGTPKAIGT